MSAHAIFSLIGVVSLYGCEQSPFPLCGETGFLYGATANGCFRRKHAAWDAGTCREDVGAGVAESKSESLEGGGGKGKR